jgi:hypothetical protein
MKLLGIFILSFVLGFYLTISLIYLGGQLAKVNNKTIHIVLTIGLIIGITLLFL